MRHIKLLLLAATPTVVACNGIEDSADLQPSPSQLEPQPVAFDAYVNRNTTRGGATGELTLPTLKDAAVGFGVFGYYTDGVVYDQTAVPNFMYNQQVTWTATEGPWAYSPLKYWPNEEGTNGSYDTDRLTFFAYAPYTAVSLTTGRAESAAKTGIMALSRPTDSGDPMVRYYASMKPTESVDLCWGTPHVDETQPAVGSTISFNFKHALSALNVQIDADIDVTEHPSTDDVDEHTRIYVRSVTFQGFAEKGQLDLYSTTTPIWNNLDCDCDVTSQPITIYDGRRDGHEGISASLNEPRTGLNPDLIQSASYNTASTPYSTTPGVTKTAVNLFDVSAWPYADPANPTDGELAAALAAPIYVIPTNDEMKVTIVYDVETHDDKLVSQYLSDGKTHGSTIENCITATIKSGDDPITMEAGKRYNIHLHLGMVSVKVTADVTAWGEESNAEMEVPKN